MLYRKAEKKWAENGRTKKRQFFRKQKNGRAQKKRRPMGKTQKNAHEKKNRRDQKTCKTNFPKVLWFKKKLLRIIKKKCFSDKKSKSWDGI